MLKNDAFDLKFKNLKLIFSSFHLFQDGYIFPEACSCRMEMQPDDIMN